MKLKFQGVVVDVPENEVKFYLHVGYKRIKEEEKTAFEKLLKKKTVKKNKFLRDSHG